MRQILAADSGPGADKGAVRLARKEAYNASDAAAVTAPYGDDAVLSARARRAWQGCNRRLLRQDDRAVLDLRTHRHRRADGRDVTSCDLAWHWKTYTVTDDGVVEGKLVTLFQRTDGKWLIVGDT